MNSRHSISEDIAVEGSRAAFSSSDSHRNLHPGSARHGPAGRSHGSKQPFAYNQFRPHESIAESVHEESHLGKSHQSNMRSSIPSASIAEDSYLGRSKGHTGGAASSRSRGDEIVESYESDFERMSDNNGSRHSLRSPAGGAGPF